jgi:hypothetical protein
MLLILMVTSKGMAGVPRASLVVIAARSPRSTFRSGPAADHGHRPVPRHGPLGDQCRRQQHRDGGRREVEGELSPEREAQAELDADSGIAPARA